MSCVIRHLREPIGCSVLHTGVLKDVSNGSQYRPLALSPGFDITARAYLA
jgi:hypothetical protein